MTTLTHTAHRTTTRRARPSLLRLLDLWRSRQDLAGLDAAALKDIGLSAEDARREAARPAWDVPAHWLR